VAEYNKLNRPTGPRKALLRNLVTALIWNGRIETTEAKAKAAQQVAERLITLAVKEYANNITVQKTVDEKGVKVQKDFTNDAPSKLQARRQMMAYLYDVKPLKEQKESKHKYNVRTKDVKYPVIEKLFRDIGPKYDKRAKDKGQGGGYTRIVKKGPRRGDAAEIVIVELV
jgi:large subunit ribosomal protein L17